MRINKHDTQGTKPLLGKGELGYDDYDVGGDVGRVYVGTGSENIALAEKLEANMMTKAQFNALAEERKANRAGSGFEEWGVYNATGSATTFFGSGTSVRGFQNMIVSSMAGGSWDGTVFSCFGKNSSSIISGVIHKHVEASAIRVPTAPTIYPHDTVLTAEQIASGVIKHADASNSGLIVNGKFDVDTSGWINSSTGTGTFTYNAGKVSISGTSSSNRGSFSQTLDLVIGKNYTVECDVSNVVGLVNIAGTGVGNGGQAAVNGRNYFTFTAISTGFFIYTQSSGGSATFDNIAVYPADAISRSDLVFLESWHEDISEKNFVYPLGNVQYLGGNTDGLTGIANGSFSGFEQYSLFGNWQTPSALIGKGYVWSNLTEAQKRAFIANPENNCYLDGDKVIQVRYRVRVVQGLGDTTNSFSNLNSNSYLALFELGSNSIGLINAKGKKVSTNETKTYADRITTGSYLNISSSYGECTISTAGTPVDVAYDGKCFALPIALISRRNQGMYHPVYNPNGTKKASDGNFWYNTAISFTSISDCFDPAKLLAASGSIGSVSGRPDGLFYDQVHESDILDLRNSSKKVEDYNRLINRELNKLIAGTNRGKEGEFAIIKNNVSITDSSQTSINVYMSFNNLGISQAEWVQGAVDVLFKFSSLPNSNGSYQIGTWYKVSKSANNTASMLLIAPNSITATGMYTAEIIVSKSSTRTKSNAILHCDIIGNPANYPTAWKESGVFGTPLIVAEDGSSLLPDGAIDTFKLSRKANAIPLLCLRSTDSGATWTSFTPIFNTVTNEITLTDEPTNNLVMVYYQTHTSMAVPVVNMEVLEVGDVVATNNNNLSSGNPLIGTLIEKVATYNNATPTPAVFRTKINSFELANTINTFNGMRSVPTHDTIPLTGNATSPAVKVFPYLTRTNGKAYLNLVFKEMKHNGTSWGDDNKFNIVSNVSTTTDNNAQKVLIGQKTVELPYFIAGDE